jgi:uncharacterized alkaline shock family protein YloU
LKTLGVVDRIVLSVYTIGLIVASLGLLAMAAGWSGPLGWIRTGLSTDGGRATFAAIGIVLLGTSVRLLAVAFVGGGASHAIVHNLPLGRVKVSLPAVEGLVVRLVRNTPGVKEAKAAVKVEGELLQIKVRLVVGPEIPIGELSEAIQESVKSQVRQVVGVAVERVDVEVDHITPTPRRSRVD